MYYVTKRMEIAGCHRLRLSYESKCANMHGHNWVVTVYCRARNLNRDGMVIDFKHIKEKIHDYLDHGDFNSLLPFNPTAENIAKWVVDQIPQCYKATVQESEGNIASYCDDREDGGHQPVNADALQPSASTSTIKINEIFYSLQGEGKFVGTPAVFIRFSGCNLACDFCDTDHSTGREMTVSEIIDEVKRHPASHVVITGGEPVLQLNDSLVDALHRERKFVQIETNGTRPLSGRLAETLDWITVSPKRGCTPVIQRIDELKVVFDMDHPDHVEALADIETGIHQNYFLQPCDRANEQWNARNLEACVSYILQHPKWRLSLQTHKMIDIK